MAQVNFKMTWKMWFLAVCLVASIFAINPLGYFQHGVLVKYVPENSLSSQSGLTKGEIITAMNDLPISSMADYSDALGKIFLNVHKQNITLITNKAAYDYSAYNLGIEVDDNLGITFIPTELNYLNITLNETVESINSQTISNISEFNAIRDQLDQKIKLTIITNKGTRILFASYPEFTVSEVPKTRLKAGLDLAGGAKALVQPERKLTQSELADLITVSKERLNVYGISDIAIRAASDLSGNTYMIVEVAGASPAELQDLIGKQGKFEAKIGEDSVFVGGKDDIKSVCRNDASCSGIQECQQSQGGYYCNFQFVIYLSPEAAQKQGEVTGKLDINMTSNGERILSKPLDLYLDDQLVDSLQIDASLKGKTDATSISIRGPGTGTTQQEAFNNAKANMLKLQTVLITGSLPFKLQIVKLDSISPLLGKEFVNNILLAALGAGLAVALIIFIRYRRLVYSLPILFTVGAEILIILGVSAAINWNLDLVSIAGILAAIGTGVDNQIVIIDESRNKKVSHTLKEKIKRAFFIIFGSFSTAFVAMIPLWWAGAGMVRGFAVTTIIGICIGVFITRPAFSDFIGQVSDEHN